MKKTTIPATERISGNGTNTGTEEILSLRQRHTLPLPQAMYTSPIQIVRGDRQWLFDEKGRRYLDAFAGVATVSIGHSHPHWVKKINEQVSTLFHTTTLYLHPSMGHYAKRLIEKVRPANPELDVCYFANSGSEANEMATMLAKTYTGNHELVAQRHSYHGGRRWPSP